MIREDNFRPAAYRVANTELEIIEAFFWIAGPAPLTENANICMKLTPKYNFVFPHQSIT
jgi:hypothetical protein